MAVLLLREAESTFFGIELVEGALDDVADVGPMALEGGGDHFFDSPEDVISGGFGDVDVVIFEVVVEGVSPFGIVIFVVGGLAQPTAVEKRFPGGGGRWMMIGIGGGEHIVVPSEVEEGQSYDRQCENRAFSSPGGCWIWNHLGYNNT